MELLLPTEEMVAVELQTTQDLLEMLDLHQVDLLIVIKLNLLVVTQNLELAQELLQLEVQQAETLVL